MKKKLIVVAFIFAILLSGCGTKLYTDGNAEGYTSINNVDGVSFSMLSKVVSNATAVTNISENMNFERNQTYVFKNGESKYMLFNLSSVVLAVEKNTEFNLENAKDKKEAVLSHDVLGIWFDIPGKKLEYTDNTADGVYKFMATVNGEVSITSELYNDFTGKLVVIDDGQNEWSLFIGQAGTDPDELGGDSKKAINYIAASLTKAVLQPQVEELGVVAGGTYENDAANTDSVTTVDESVAGSSLKTTVEVNDDLTTEDVIESSSEIFEEAGAEASSEKSDEVEIIEVVSDEPTDEASKEGSEESGSIASTEITEKASSESSEDVESNNSNEPTAQRGDRIVLNNQKKKERTDNTSYESSIYDMLTIGNWGFADIKNIGSKDRVEVKITDLVVGKEASMLIKEACASKTVPYQYFDAPAGCTWHLVKVTAKENKGYVDVKLVGADGNKLNYKGIKYTKRTYEIRISETEMYVYYAVPNGCPEYVLEIGDGTIENGMNSAYYLLNEY